MLDKIFCCYFDSGTCVFCV